MNQSPETFDALMARYLGSSLETATGRLIGSLAIAAAVAALIIKLL
ncbi:MAG TPA: hypothetical protein VM689_06090 [Aliidongia sp.]|nr:hypothetical protein [Aliidongia sp.]